MSLIKKLQEEKSRLCLECQECCKVFKLPLNKYPTQQDREFYKIRGLRLILDDSDGRFYLVFPLRCPQLTPHGCAIYDKRPQACRAYDGRDDPAVNCKWRDLNFDFGEKEVKG